MSANITITDSAWSRIATILATKPTGTKFRVAVDGGGCSGFKYDFGCCEEETADDLRFTHQDLILLVDNISINYINGATLDFIEELGDSHFKIINPNAAGGCGCGNSFSI